MTRIFAILLVATACGGVIFNSTTVAMPKVFDERLRSARRRPISASARWWRSCTRSRRSRRWSMGALIDRFELRRLMIGVALVQIPLLALAANLRGLGDARPRRSR